MRAVLASLLGVAVVAVERHAIVVGDFLKHHGDEAEALSLIASDLLMAPDSAALVRKPLRRLWPAKDAASRPTRRA